jgi:AraC family transcriptional regulator of adaptative response/methylated-DNA-[protein]-cysteine methyltransferase
MGPVGSSGVPDRHVAWEVVRTRDATYAGQFVYAVRTTMIYCSPGCASRTPKSENVEFFATCEEAEARAYRACRRCRPDESRPAPGFPQVEQARTHLDANLRETITLDELSKVVGLSPFHLQRTFKKYLGVTPREYVEMRRADRMRELLRDGDEVGRALYEAGYSSTSRLYEQADAHLGMTPGTYSRGGAGMLIHYATAATRLGRLLVAATDRGVCRVALGESDERLVDELRREHTAAAIVPANGGLASWLEAIVGFVEGRTRRLDVPLDVRASTFQWRVWRILRNIPFGETRTYREIAEAVGAPGAARAVGGACASNPTALVIPCHRVVRQDGTSGGYRWGAARKRLLLKMESDAVDAAEDA